MATLHLIKTYQGFIPADQDSADAMEKMPWRKEFKAEITQPRNIGYHRKFMALIGVAFDAWEMPVNEYKGIQIEKNRDRRCETGVE